MSGLEAAAAISPFWEAIKSGICFCCARAEYFDDLESSLESLKREIIRLKEMKEHVEGRVRQEKKPQMQQLYNVTDWLRRVDASLENADDIFSHGEEEIGRKAIRFFFPKHCCSYNRAGKKVNGKLKEVTDLIRDGGFGAVVEKRGVDLVNEMPVPETVGLELKVEEIWRLVEDRSVGIIGLYGMGGVGKTTLLKKMYNKIWRTSEYVLIWVDRSDEDPVKAVHEAIRKKFEISEELWRNKNESDSVAIWKNLRSEKFVLLLDDVGHRWHYHRLEEAGIPLNGNDNGSKVIFTTRSKEVCDRMRAKSVEVKCLPLETAQELFQLCVGRPILDSHSEIPKLALDAAIACNGLPLLLVTIGRAMASKTRFRDWKMQVEKLKEQLTKVADVEAQVFSVLKVSYDTLSSDTHKKCFLYFCLFPEGRNVKKQEIIELWIAEGILDYVIDPWEEGEEIISSLKLASLLENGKSEEFVKMHAVIHAMALWLACEEGKAEDKVLTQEKALESSSKWVNAERISLWDSTIKSLPHIPCCTHLTTLLLRATSLTDLPSGFFQSMPALTVLDLSNNNGLTDLPAGIAGLGSLLYLNLSGTGIKNLPSELQDLKNLRTLITGYLVKIERGFISSLCGLIVFRMLAEASIYSPQYDEERFLEELECSEHIKELGIILSSTNAVLKLLNSNKLRRCIRQLKFVKLTDQVSVPLPKLCLKSMEHLERLELWNSPSLMEVEVNNESHQEPQVFPGYRKSLVQECFQNLSFISIYNCQITNVAWLIHAPNVRTLTLCECYEMVELVDENWGKSIFDNLTDLSLTNLPKLEYICRQTLQFPCLISLSVYTCPKLKNLPFNSRSAKNLKEIRGRRDWWDGLQWTSDTVKDIFFLKLQQSKQKVVIKVQMTCEKCRSKALKVAAACSGVEYVAIRGPEKNQIEVIGKELDAVKLAVSLRKKLGHAELISIGPTN
ncbi:probable disease resistance protein At5g63020 [Mercurialis annua]|uniref:probable disease resistance protein At5g63020 n=1 Tax=Mercurialis annua TaxID=3986 RepID=UPI002160D67A|nr:probable disease resistance protein At5g63020 [Mercurialis annua]XP_050232783.1 probable disease resistance protein At5g63020 [Mercurialis annua]